MELSISTVHWQQDQKKAELIFGQILPKYNILKVPLLKFIQFELNNSSDVLKQV